MKYTSLHKVITGYLLQKRYPIHFYVECLVHAARCFEELHFDSLGNVRAKRLPINEQGRVTLPCDYMDYCKVGVVVGQYVRPLYERNGLNRISNYDDAGNKIPYSTGNEDSSAAFYQFYGYSSRFNEKLENTGRRFGSRGDNSGSFKIVKEDNEIAVNIDIDATEIILEYISDGQETDNATQINPYAKSPVEAYINWKMKENGRSYSEYERTRAMRLFEHERGILRGRLAGWTIAGIKAIVNQNTHGAPK